MHKKLYCSGSLDYGNDSSDYGNGSSDCVSQTMATAHRIMSVKPTPLQSVRSMALSAMAVEYE